MALNDEKKRKKLTCGIARRQELSVAQTLVAQVMALLPCTKIDGEINS